ncbi:MAG: glycosyltransferase family 2 protein [Actinomycetota bacterium]
MTLLLIQIIFGVSFFLIAHTYIFYPLFLLVLGRKRRKTIIVNDCDLPTASLIISAYNEEEVIREKIENSLAIDYPRGKLKIIIVSDGSTDETNRIAREYAKVGIFLNDFPERLGKPKTLNKTILQERTTLIILSDANTIYEPDAIKKLVRNFVDPRIACVCGELKFKGDRKTEVAGLENFYWRFEQFLKKREGERGALLGANGGIYAFHRELFEPLPPNSIVDDFIIPLKMLEKGYKIVYEPEAVGYEKTTNAISQEMERRIRIGAGDFQVLFLTQKMLNPNIGFASFAFISHKLLRWLTPFFLILLFISNAILAVGPVWNLVFFLQCLFYLLALFGFLFYTFGLRLRLFGIPYYFSAMNLALLLGFIRFCSGAQSVTWEKTQR